MKIKNGGPTVFWGWQSKGEDRFNGIVCLYLRNDRLWVWFMVACYNVDGNSGYKYITQLSAIYYKIYQAKYMNYMDYVNKIFYKIIATNVYIRKHIVSIS